MDDRTASAIGDLLASASIFSSAMNEVMADRLRDVAGDRLTFAQLKVLTLVAHTEGIAVSDIATFLGVSPAAASKAVGRLAENGLLGRSAVPGDRRVQHLSLTRDGRDLLGRYEAAAERSLDELFGHLDALETRRLSVALDRLSLKVAESRDAGESETCFRCGIYFRDHCLLRGAPGNRTCYQHLDRRVAGRGAAVTT